MHGNNGNQARTRRIEVVNNYVVANIHRLNLRAWALSRPLIIFPCFPKKLSHAALWDESRWTAFYISLG